MAKMITLYRGAGDSENITLDYFDCEIKKDELTLYPLHNGARQ